MPVFMPWRPAGLWGDVAEIGPTIQRYLTGT
jgi:hypothetical protein